MEDYDTKAKLLEERASAEEKRNVYFSGFWNALADGAGVSIELLGIAYALSPGFSKGNTFEEYMATLASGAFVYLVGHGIRMHQSDKKTRNELNNIEKLLTEQNKIIKGI